MHVLISVSLTITGAALAGCVGLQSRENSSASIQSVAPEHAPETVTKKFSQAVVFAYRVTPTERVGEFETDGGSTAIVLTPNMIQTARHGVHSPLNETVNLYLIRRQTTGTVVASGERAETNGDWVLFKLDTPIFGREEKVPGLSFTNLPIQKGESVFLLGFIVEGSDNVVPAILRGTADSDFAAEESIWATIDSRLFLGGMSGGALAVQRGDQLVVVGSLRRATDPNHRQQPRILASRLSPQTLQAVR